MARTDVEYIIGLRDRMSGRLGQVGKNVNRLDQQMRVLRNTVGLLFTGFIAREVIGGIIKVGSEFEQLQISFETMLGSAAKANVLIKDLTEFALKTPFELKDVAKGAKALLAFGIENEKILPSLKALGDVAAGTSQPIARLILNFGQVKTQAKLTGRELRDFATLGVPILPELAKNMGKTTATITEMVSKGVIGFKEVEDAFISMSSEGGKFFNLMEKQTASTGGQISNLRDVIGLLQRDLFNRLKPSIDAVIVVIQNMTIFLRDNIENIITVTKIIGVLTAAILTVKLAIGGATIAMGLFNAVSNANPYILLAKALLVVGGLLFAFHKRADKATKSQTGLQKITEKFNKSLIQERAQLNTLFRIAKNENTSKETRRKAIQEINTLMGDYLPNLLSEEASIRDIEKAQLAANVELIRSIQIKQKQAELTEIETKRLKIASQVSKIIAKGKTAGVGASLFQDFKGVVSEIEGGISATGFIVDKFGNNVVELQKNRLPEFAKSSGIAIEVLVDQARKLKFANDIAERSSRMVQAFFGGEAGLLGATAAGAQAARTAAAQAGVTKITSAAPKIFNINIGSLIENNTISSTTINQGTEQLKKLLTEALLGVIADTQTLTR